MAELRQPDVLLPASFLLPTVKWLEACADDGEKPRIAWSEGRTVAVPANVLEISPTSPVKWRGMPGRA